VRVAAIFAAGAVLLAAPVAHANAASEAEATALFDASVGNQAMLRLFLQAMPKGGDLHNHLSGTPSAEDFLDWAAKAGYCADAKSLDLIPPPCAADDKVDRMAGQAPFTYARLVDHLSTRGWQRGIGTDQVSGHTQFFITFDRFGVVAQQNVAPMMLVALRTTAGDNASYLELMHNPSAMMRHVLAAPNEPLNTAGLEARYAEELEGLAPVISAARVELDGDEAATRKGLASRAVNRATGRAANTSSLPDGASSSSTRARIRRSVSPAISKFTRSFGCHGTIRLSKVT